MPPLAAISEAISHALHRPFHARAQRAVGGGCIHRALEIEDGSRRYFVKLNGEAAAPMFEAEADGLAAIAAAGAENHINNLHQDSSEHECPPEILPGTGSKGKKGV